MKIKAILFDKDGTLFDFNKTWGHWANILFHDLAEGNPKVLQRLMDTCRFDPVETRFFPDSPIIAGTAQEAGACIAQALGEKNTDAILEKVNQAAANVPLAPVVDLIPYLEDLQKRGIILGVMTNDAESVAHAHLHAVGCHHLFEFIAGFDSGFGAKPDPAPLLAFANHTGITPPNIAMVGDSTHDLIAAKHANMYRIAVLTGVAKRPDLEPFSDIVLNDIGEIPTAILDNMTDYD